MTTFLTRETNDALAFASASAVTDIFTKLNHYRKLPTKLLNKRDGLELRHAAATLSTFHLEVGARQHEILYMARVER